MVKIDVENDALVNKFYPVHNSHIQPNIVSQGFKITQKIETIFGFFEKNFSFFFKKNVKHSFIFPTLRSYKVCIMGKRPQGHKKRRKRNINNYE